MQRKRVRSVWFFFEFGEFLSFFWEEVKGRREGMDVLHLWISGWRRRTHLLSIPYRVTSIKHSNYTQNLVLKYLTNSISPGKVNEIKLVLSSCKFLCRYLSTNGLSIPPLLPPTIPGRKEDYSCTKRGEGEKRERTTHPAFPFPPKPMI